MGKPETLRKLWKSRRAVSRAVIELLMIAMVVVTAVGVYSVYTGISAPTSARSQEHLTIDSVKVASDRLNVTAYVRNDGAAEITLDRWYTFDSAGAQVETGTFAAATVVPVGTVLTQDVPSSGDFAAALTDGSMYKLRIVTKTGIFGEYVFTA